MNEFKVIDVTPDLAKKFLEKNIANRPVNKATVRAYVRDMKEDKWTITPDVIGFDENGNLMNGQHRLLAVIESGTTQKFIVGGGFPDESFSATDKGRKRTGGDILNVKANVAQYNQMASIVRAFINLTKSRNISNGNKDTNPTNRDILDAYNQYKQVFDRAVQLAQRCYKKLNFLGTREVGGIYSFLVIEKQYESEYVKHFFEELFFSIDNNPTVTLLRDKLIKDKISKARLRYGIKVSMIAKTWNAYVAGRTLKLLKVSEDEGTIRFN